MSDREQGGAGQGSEAREREGMPAVPRSVFRDKWTWLVLALTLLFVMTPFLFWRATWFGMPLSNAQLAQALKDTAEPREIQHGLSQVADRIIRGDPSVKQFYPEVLALASSPIDEIRTMDAWVMGQDNKATEFHAALLRLLADKDPMVARNAALGLVRFGDAAGRPVILSMLQPLLISAPAAGALETKLHADETLHANTVIARIDVSGKKEDIRCAMPGTLDRWLVSNGATVGPGQPVALVYPSDDVVWEALRALYLIGQPSDLGAIAPYARGAGDAPPKIAEQARQTMEEIRERAAAKAPTPDGP